MRRTLATVATVAVLLVAMAVPATARNPVTRGDVQAQFEAVETGGMVIRMKKGFETTIPPANGLIHSIRPIQPVFNDRHYCDLDWHLITIAFLASEGEFLPTLQEQRDAFNGAWVTFKLDNVLLPAEEATAVKTIAGSSGDAIWRAWGIFYPPGVLPVGSHRLTGFATFSDGFSFNLDRIRFHIDSAGEGTCL